MVFVLFLNVLFQSTCTFDKNKDFVLQSDQFLCKDRRKCVRRTLVCDGYSHCADGSDEKQCPTCALHCDQKMVCLTNQQLCDGKPDCRDGSDERNCCKFSRVIIYLLFNNLHVVRNPYHFLSFVEKEKHV